MESWQTQPLLWLKIGSYTELQVVADGTQNFESVCFIVARLIARAGETMDVDTTNTSPKISNLFFIFLSPFVFCFCGWRTRFFCCDHKKFYSITWSGGEATTQNSPIFFPWEIKTKFRFISTSQQHF